MDVVYGEGVFEQENGRFKGKIILTDHKLYLRTSEGDCVPTYIPVEKIVRVIQKGRQLLIEARLSPTQRRQTVIAAEPAACGSLVRDLVERRQLKKRWWRKEWVDVQA